MSSPDPDPTPPAADAAAPRISDRAALEAALAGAAGLLLGRLLLGRGAGLLAGGAAIAARLLKDAAASAPAQAAREPVTSPEAEASSLAETEVLEEVAREVAADDGWPELGVTPVAGPPVTNSATSAPSAAPQPTASSTAAEEASKSASNPFANLFREAPKTLVPAPATAPLPSIPEPTVEPPAPQPVSPLPAFPPLTSVAPVEATATESDAVPLPASAPDPALSGLPDFPELGADILPPEEIWKMAARETEPIPGVAGPAVPTARPEPTSSAEHAPSAESSPFLAFTETAIQPQRQAWVVPSDASNPFAALMESPEPRAAVPDPEPIAPAVPLPEGSPQAGLPPGFTRPAPQEITSTLIKEDDSAAIPPAKELFAPSPESPVPNAEPPAPTPAVTEAPTSPRERAELPVISLKASSKPSPVATEAKVVVEEVPSPAVEVPLVEAQESLPTTTPPSSAGPRTKSSSGCGPKALLGILILAVCFGYNYWNGLSKSEKDPHESGTPTPAALPAGPLQAPGQPTPPALAPAPAPTLIPAPVPNPDPSSPARTAEPVLPPVKPTSEAPQPSVPPTTPTAPAASVVPTEPEPVVYAEPTPGVPQDFPPGSPDAQAREVLEKLLAARYPDDLTPLVFRPQEAVRRIPNYYPDGQLHPAPWRRILFDSADQIPNSPFKARIFRVVTDAVPLGFPVAVEDTKEGPRIDFDAFVQCRDRLLDAFMANPAALPGRFLVVLRRGHYFGDALSTAEQENLICLEVASPNLSSAKYPVFVRRNTELAKLALRKYVWDRNFTPILELSHVDGQVFVSAIVQDSWRSPVP